MEAERCEQLVANSGLAYTLVQASWFNQNFSESFFLDPVLAGHVALPSGGQQVPFVDTDDIAAVATAALVDDAHNGQTYYVSGPRMMSFAEAVAEIAKATGRSIAFEDIPLEAYTAAMEQMQVPKDFIWLAGYLFAEVLGNEANSVVSTDVERVLGRPAKDFSAYAQEVAATGVWHVPAEQAEALP